MMMNALKTYSLAIIALAAAPIAEARVSLPVSTEGGHGLSLVGVGAEMDDGAVHTSGWVRRDVGRYNVNNAHLHVAYTGLDGTVLHVAEARWNGTLRSGPRGHRTVSFHVRTAIPEGKQVASVRVSVERGPRHDENRD